MDDLRHYFSLESKSNLVIGITLSIEELNNAANWIISKYRMPVVSLNKELSKLLIRKQQVNYPKEIIDLISKRINEIEEDPILVTDIDILFEPSFQLNPLVIFRQASRNKKLLVLWPGEYKNNKLSYATPEHAHYRNWGNPGIEIIHV